MHNLETIVVVDLYAFNGCDPKVSLLTNLAEVTVHGLCKLTLTPGEGTIIIKVGNTDKLILQY